MITYTDNISTGLAEIVVDGKVTKEDFDRISPQLEAFIQKKGSVKLLEEIRNFKGFDFSVLGKGAKFDLKHMKDFSHCAVVTDKGWIGPFARMAGAFVSCEICVFKNTEMTDARAWLAAA